MKDKRRVIKSCMQRLRNTFPLSVAEVGLHDSHSEAEIALVLVNSDGKLVNSILDKAEDFLDQLGDALLISFRYELLTGL